MISILSKLAIPLAVVLSLGFVQEARAGWLGIRNDTAAPVSVQLCTSGRMSAPISLGAGETSWNFVANDGTSTVIVSTPKKVVLLRFETVPVTSREDILYAIQSSGKDQAVANRVMGAKKGR